MRDAIIRLGKSSGDAARTDDGQATCGYLQWEILGNMVVILEASIVNVAQTECHLDSLHTIRKEARSGDDLVHIIIEEDTSLLGRNGQLINLSHNRIDDLVRRLGYVVLDLAAQSHNVVLDRDESTWMVLRVNTDVILNGNKLARDTVQVAPEVLPDGVALWVPRVL